MKIRAIKHGLVGDKRIRRNVEADIDPKDFNPKWMESLEQEVEAEVEEKKEEKPKRKRRSKEEIEAANQIEE